MIPSIQNEQDCDPHHFDNGLCKKPHPTSRCQTSFTVKVKSYLCFVNFVGEVKTRFSTLDCYRIGMFSLALYEQNGMESVTSFHTKDLNMTFNVIYFH
ncbi:hypothetical protein A0J61_07733 [Choanephora cucurbitarum]|uniref:Uncharacterized protein n=1 Tax=Choanephora cucurbitarum TaxID=101091 RepID=A0A1C7N512_9FUNG|nr:hypothetical protein A0J61_07733 [Choanephora cucurbitarum]